MGFVLLDINKIKREDNMDAICTIAAKNYLPHAFTLGDSLAKTNPDLDFYILLADEIGGVYDPSAKKYTIIEARSIGIPTFDEMAFKYDVVEFCTSVKPFFIEYLFKNHGYDKVVYLDPDMYVYKPLDEVLDVLDENFVALTPHIIKPYVEFKGAISEEELLFVGIYNLGFAAFRDCHETRHVLSWWKAKLADQCFADKEDALHVDQRWMDFLPALYEKGVCIFRHPGYNLSHWNMHERTFVDSGDRYVVDNDYPLVVFHFSGFDPHNYESICRKQTIFHLKDLPDYKRLFEAYTAELLANGFDIMKKFDYHYSKYDNGISIIKYQRRLYRAMLQEGYLTDNPFATVPGTFFDLLNKNNLVIEDRSGNFNRLRKTVTGYDRKIAVMQRFMRFFKNVVGIKYYYLMMRFLSMYSRFEKQLFLVQKR